MKTISIGRFNPPPNEVKLVWDWILYMLMDEFADETFISHYIKKEKEFTSLWWLENVIKRKVPLSWNDEFKAKLLAIKPKKFSKKEFENSFNWLMMEYWPQFIYNENGENDKEVVEGNSPNEETN